MNDVNFSLPPRRFAPPLLKQEGSCRLRILNSPPVSGGVARSAGVVTTILINFQKTLSWTPLPSQEGNLSYLSFNSCMDSVIFDWTALISGDTRCPYLTWPPPNTILP